MNEVQQNGGRFLKRAEEQQNSASSKGATDNAIDTQQWVEVTYKRACEKASQALREGLDVRTKEKGEHDSSTGESSTTRTNKKRKTNNVNSSNINGRKSEIESNAASMPTENDLWTKLSKLQNTLPPLGIASNSILDESSGNLSTINENTQSITKSDDDVVGV